MPKYNFTNSDNSTFSSDKTIYEILEVSKETPGETIRKQYMRLVMKHHPDKGGDRDKFQELRAAYEIATDPVSKANYDAYLESQASSSPKPSHDSPRGRDRSSSFSSSEAESSSYSDSSRSTGTSSSTSESPRGGGRGSSSTSWTSAESEARRPSYSKSSRSTGTAPSHKAPTEPTRVRFYYFVPNIDYANLLFKHYQSSGDKLRNPVFIYNFKDSYYDELFRVIERVKFQKRDKTHAPEVERLGTGAIRHIKVSTIEREIMRQILETIKATHKFCYEYVGGIDPYKRQDASDRPHSGPKR